MRRILCALTIAITIAITPVPMHAGDGPSKPYRLLVVPALDNQGFGYAHFASTLISSSEQMSAFLDKLRARRGQHQRPEALEFERSLREATINFEKEALVLLRHTESSGSVQVTFEAPTLNSGVLTCRIAKKVPDLCTANMAYYCFALAVSKTEIAKVELYVKTAELSVGKQPNKPDTGDGK